MLNFPLGKFSIFLSIAKRLHLISRRLYLINRRLYLINRKAIAYISVTQKHRERDAFSVL